VNSLTVSNSGLSQSEIAYYQNLVLESSKELQGVEASLDAALLSLGGANSSLKTVTTDEILAEQKLLAEAQAELDLLEQQYAVLKNSAVPDSNVQQPSGGGGPVEPPIKKPGPPALIEGSNKN